MKKEMKKEKRFGKLPINCRINIDYTNGKPKIKFGYPHKKQQQHLADHSGPHIFITIFIYTLITIGLFYLIYFNVIERIDYPENCSVNFTYSKTYSGLVNGSSYYSNNETIKGNQVYQNWTLGSIAVYNKSLDGMNISCDGFNQTFTLNRYRFNNRFSILLSPILDIWHDDYIVGFKEDIPRINPGLTIFLLLIFYTVVIGWLFLLFWLNKYVGRFMLKFKWYQKFIPEWNKKLSGGGYYKTIKSGEVPANKIIELPLFKNIYLDYNTKGEFAKYLERVEIREHPFCTGIFKKGKLKKKKGDNYMLWYAKFYFKEIPKNGEMMIMWK
jgi:archaellum component FlaF (FlaF/FlaG flagellin family)